MKKRGRPAKLEEGKPRQVYMDEVTWLLLKKYSGGNVSAWIRDAVWSLHELTTPVEGQLED